MRNIALCFTLLATTFSILPLNVTRTKQSGSIPVDISIEDVSSTYKEVDNSLYYYKISATNASLEYKTYLSSQETLALGYQKANSTAWIQNFWQPFYTYEAACLGATGIVSLSLLPINSEKASQAFYIGCAAAALGLIVQLARHNKAEDLRSSMIVSTAYETTESTPTQTYSVPGIFVDQVHITHHGKVFKTKRNSSNSIVISVDHPLQNVEIDIAQMGTHYDIYLTER